MSHWFEIHPWMVDDLTAAEEDEYLERLRRLPPMGSTFIALKEG